MVHKGFSVKLNKWLSATPGRPARYIMLALGGMLTAFTVIFPKTGFLEWITMIPAALIIMGMPSDSSVKLRRAYGYGLFYYMSYYCVVYHWFIELYPLEFTGINKFAAVVVVIAGWFGLSLLQSLTAGLVFVLFVLIARNRIFEKMSFLKPLLLSALWCILEWSQTFFWIGVPWGRLGIGQSEFLLMLRSSAFFGPYFVTFMIVAVNSFLALAILERDKIKSCSVVAGSLVLTQLLLGVCSTFAYRPDDNSKIKAAVIQGNVSSSEKWDVTADDLIDNYTELSLAAAKDGAGLIIWPETAIPITLTRSPQKSERLKEIAKLCNADILVGMFTETEKSGDSNSLVLFRRDGTVSDDIYSKRRLVPFGEYVPMRKIIEVLIPPLTKIAMLAEDVVPGEDTGLIYSSDGICLGSLICFDSIYEQENRQSVLDGAELIVISTNDSWFFDSVGVHMHNAQAKMRAIESGRYVMRAANTGISSVITPQGKVIDSIDALKRGYLVEEVSAENQMTLYMKIGNTWIYLMMAFVVIMGFLTLIKKNVKLKVNLDNHDYK